ncbi:MAG: hypothetical protein JNK88_07720 [Mangrovicoccus sp.]|nr:hypothetical protein [Mangrovicoccus sp.]
MRQILILGTLAVLAGCASSQDRCGRSATKDLRTVDALIDETEANIARGYAYETVPSNINVGISYCGYSWGNVGVGLCAGNNTGTTRQAVAIDIGAEQAKLAELRRKRADLAARAAPTIAACGAPA